MIPFAQIVGRLHPLLVHLPIGILLIALAFEALGRTRRYKVLKPAIPFMLFLGALSAGLSCLTGWLLSRTGDYEAGRLNLHQWTGIAVAVVALAVWVFRSGHINRGYTVSAAILLPSLLLTAHWGITLTHGEGYLTGAGPEAAEETADEVANRDLPAGTVGEPSAEAIEILRAEGVVVLPVGREQPFLSLNFVNVKSVSSRQRQALEALKEQVAWLRFSGVPLNDSTLTLLPALKNLTRLHLDRTGIDDRALPYLLKLEYLAYLNLVGTRVTAAGVETLSALPKLKKLFLYQTQIGAAEAAALPARLPGVQIDTGGYRVPVLPTDTTEVAPPKK